MNPIAVASALAVILSSGCGGSVPPPTFPTDYVPGITGRSTSARIQHVIIVVQDQRTFDNLFAGFPGANSATFGLTHDGKRVPLRETTFYRSAECFTPYGFGAFDTAWDHGKMDGFDLLDETKPLCPYTRISRAETEAYWDLAKRYALADNAFASTRYGALANRQYLVAGSTEVAKDEYVIGFPSEAPFGCDAPFGARTTLLTPKGIVDRGPFPCFKYPTIAQRLDEKSISWKYYSDTGSASFAFNAYEAIRYVREGRDWETDVVSPAARVLSDLKSGNLKQVSWVISGMRESDAPFVRSARGPAWVNSIVQTAQGSRYWSHLAIVVVWASDGSEAFYDNAAPPQVSRMGLGLRVPMIVISPYAKRGYVSHTVYQNGGSTLRFIEESFGLKSLGATDVTANSIRDCFVR